MIMSKGDKGVKNMKKNKIIKELKVALKVFHACDESVLIVSAKIDDGYRFEFGLIEYERTRDYIRIDLENNELELFNWVNLRGYYVESQTRNINRAIAYVNKLLKENSKNENK